MWRRSPGPAARVPELIGLEVRVAQDLALDAGVLAVEADLHRSQAHAGVVTGQVPSAGRRVGVGSRVWIWVGPDRAEPRRRAWKRRRRAPEASPGTSAMVTDRSQADAEVATFSA